MVRCISLVLALLLCAAGAVMASERPENASDNMPYVWDEHIAEAAKDPKSAAKEAEVCLQTARMARELGDTDSALAYLTTGILLSPSAPLYNERGHVLYGLERDEEALLDYINAVELAPEDASLRYNCANVLNAMKRYAEAAFELDTAIKLDPQARYYHLRALMYGWQGQFEQALPDCDRAIELEPENAQYYDDRSMVLQWLDRYEEALRDSDQAVLLAPAQIDYYVNRSYAHFALEMYDEALADLDAAIAAQEGEAPESLAEKRAQLLEAIQKKADEGAE